MVGSLAIDLLPIVEKFVEKRAFGLRGIAAKNTLTRKFERTFRQREKQ
jgi:hypothetical protein